jgi:formylglycine-generating enzyme required for sulfatase activity
VLRYTAGDGTAKCAEPTKSGSVAAKIVITDKDVYRFELAAAVPEQSGGDTTLVLRKDCPLPSTQLACADDVRAGDKLSGITTELESGTYWLVTGGRDPAGADLTLLASRRDTAVEVKPPPPPPDEDANTVEPSPGATIDRLVRLQLVPGYRGTVSVTLSGECFGTVANPTSLQTCIDTAGTSVIADAMLPDGPLVRDRPRPPAWDGEHSEPCTATPRGPSPLFDEEVCIPGGAFLLGDNLALTDLEYRTRPEHVRVVGPFLLDRYEFTVGRYREAIRRGFAPSETPHVNNGPVAPGQEHGGCTWNFADRPDQPAANVDRESFPLNCIRWEDARALCTFFGGDLPTEDQWEYAATASGRPTETQYPWGSDLPTCDRVIVERSDTGATRCAPAYGPTAVDDPGWAARDSTPTGVIGMGGNIQEWLATGFYPYTHPVWWRAGIRAPLAPSANDTAPLRATRGGDWADFALYATSSARRAAPPRGDFLNIGFRCARSGR